MARLVAAIALVAACKHARAPADARSAPVPVPVPVPVPAAVPASAPPDASPEPALSITLEPSHPAHPAYAHRCALAGDPLVSACTSGGAGLALARSGTLYVVDGTTVHRYRRAPGEACRFDPAGPAIALPTKIDRAQSLDGPVYFRSGGPEWHLVAAGDAVYAADFLAGLYRIDRGKPEPACTDVFGYDSIAAAGGRLVVRRNGLEQLALGRRCTARSAGIDDHAFGTVYAARGKLYVADPAGELARYDGTRRVAVGEGARICSVSGVAACGDGACIADGSCMRLVQLAGDGSVLRTIDGAELFETRPWSLNDVAAEPGGALLVLARHRDHTGGHEVCEAAVYELPPALFAR